MSRYYVLQELEKILNSKIISEDCAKAIIQAMDDVETMESLLECIVSQPNPFDIHNNNQAYRGYEKAMGDMNNILRKQVKGDK